MNYKQILDKIVLIIAFTFPLTSVPQLIEIWYHKNVQGVSLLTWTLFMIFTIPLLIKAILDKDKEYSILWSLWCIFYVAIISGLIIYG